MSPPTICDMCPFISASAVPGLLNALPEEYYEAAVHGDPIPCMGAAVKGLATGAGGADTDVLRRVQEADTEEAPAGRVAMGERVRRACEGHHCAAAEAIARCQHEVDGKAIMGREEFIELHNS